MKKLIKILLAITISFTCITRASADNTLRDLKNELQALINKKAANEAEKNLTQSEINAYNSKITNAHAEVDQAQTDIELAKQKIEATSTKIEELKGSTEKLLVFYELAMNDNSLTNYVGSATSVTDLIMRAEAISQVLDYNEGQLKNLENLILENEQMQVDLAKKQEDLNQKIDEFQESMKSLKDNLSSLVEVTLSIDDEINALSQRVAYFEKIGCELDQDLDECVRIKATDNWMKPTDQGYISSGFGFRTFLLNGAPYSDFHPGVDVANAGAQAPVYSVSNGTVAAIIHHSTCGGNQVFIHSVVKGQKYTIQYAHLYSYTVQVGDVVTQDTVIGYVGGGGATLAVNGGWDTCSTGWHLHFGVATGYYLGGKCDGCYSDFNTFVARSIEPPFMPKFGQAYYSRY